MSDTLTVSSKMQQRWLSRKLISGWFESPCFICFYLWFYYISMGCVSMSVIVLARDGNPLCTGTVGPFLVLCLVLSCMWCECFYCYQFCRNMDLAYWKSILSAWHPIHWGLTSVSLKPLHVVFLLQCNHTLILNITNEILWAILWLFT